MKSQGYWVERALQDAKEFTGLDQYCVLNGKDGIIILILQ